MQTNETEETKTFFPWQEYRLLLLAAVVGMIGGLAAHLANLLRHGTPVPIHGSEAMLFTVNIAEGSAIAGQTIADIFERFPDLVAVAVIRGQFVKLPRGSTFLEAKDQILIAADEPKNVESFKRLAGAAAGEAKR